MAKPYQRDPAGTRMGFHGINIVQPPDHMPAGKWPYAQNVRGYLHDRVRGRATQDSSSPIAALPHSVHSLRRLNDSTPAGPAGGFILVSGASSFLYANDTQVASGMSGNPVSLVPFRPAASVQPWMYVGDSVYQKMLKVRSDKTTYLMGIAEPQVAPVVNATAVTPVVSLAGPVTAYVWGDSPHSGPVGSYIWKNPTDSSGGGPVRTPETATVTTTGSSLLFDDVLTNTGGQTPVPWTEFQSITGTVDTAGTAVTWDSGGQFGNLANGGIININAVNYTILTVNSPTSITLTGSAGTQTAVSFFAVATLGTKPLFEPKFESAGYQDFNVCIVGTFYVPVAGTYTFTGNAKDETLWGIGNNATGTASWPGPAAGEILTNFGQTKTVVSGLPLVPFTPEVDGESGHYQSFNKAVTFSEAGNYPFEFDWDYWYHQNRGMDIQCNGADITPITGSVIVESQYRYVYRSSATGATSNPSPESPVQTVASIANTITASPSSDPQVDKIDFYRLDLGLLNFTYVGTGPNSSAPFQDLLLDADVAANPILQFDNYQPFPSIDLPQKGVVNVAGGVATWASGDKFNIRWLPGTVIVVGTLAYTLDKRPTDTTHLTASNTEIVGGGPLVVPLVSGTNLPYEIAEPILAAQPLPYLWGPTDNVSFFFACGDPLRPGTLYWSKGNNPDAAPDTNQQDITSPSEPLQNGVITNGIGLVMSTERGFLIYPNFFNALATVEGTVGSTWTIQESISNRGLYIPRAIAVDGGGNVFFRAKDGVYLSPGGQGSKSITDADLYNLFPHEGFKPQPVTLGGFTVYPPDDTNPQAQQMSVANGYVYYNYEDVSGNRRTLVYDIAAGGWVPDVYGTPVVLHILEEGSGVNGTLTGCTDGSVRPLVDSGAETATSVILTPSFNAGDVRATKHFGDLYIEAEES